MHTTQLEYIERYIDTHYKSKTAFANAIGMSRQNVNYNLAEAKKNDGALPYNFALRLKDKGIPLPDIKFVDINPVGSDSEQSGGILNEWTEEYAPNKPNMTTELMYLRQRVRDLEDKVSLLTDLLKMYKKETPDQQVDAELGSKRRAG